MEDDTLGITVGFPAFRKCLLLMACQQEMTRHRYSKHTLLNPLCADPPVLLTLSPTLERSRCRTQCLPRLHFKLREGKDKSMYAHVHCFITHPWVKPETFHLSTAPSISYRAKCTRLPIHDS